MTIDSGGGWLTPERKKLIVVSLYIWVPLVVISALAWKYYPSEYGYLNKTDIKIIISGLIVTVPMILYIYLITKDKSIIIGAAISLVWLEGLGWGKLSTSSSYAPDSLILLLSPALICYLYHRKSVVKFTFIGYIAALLFGFIDILVGIFIGGLIGWVVA